MGTAVLYDASLFRVICELQAHVAVFKRELAGIAPDQFVDCPHTTLYSHGWQVFPLVMGYWPFACDFERNRATCPETYALLSRHPEIGCAGFSRLLPGCHIFPHCDNPSPGQLRGHLALRTNREVRMRIGKEYLDWEPDRFQVFDTAIEHEVHNPGPTPRDILLVDFMTTPEEREAIARSAGGGS
jgi:aspartyl/asparaginyl beta-hydroxylase (cupin superfamily)